MKVWILLAMLAACAAKPVREGNDGAQLYQSVCASCHGSRGKPTAAMVARLDVRDLTAPELRARLTLPLVTAQIRNGSPNKLMPGFAGALTDEQIVAIAAYVVSPAFLAP